MAMVLAVVGTTILDAHNEHTAMVAINLAYDILAPTLVVSGGAKGIDKLAAALAKARGIEVKEYKPEVQKWDPPGQVGFKARNALIALLCDSLLRLPSKRSKTYGSGWTRDQAKAMGKPTWQVDLA